MLIHVLSAELLFVVVPFTKLAHVVLFPFDRLSAGPLAAPARGRETGRRGALRRGGAGSDARASSST